jgi:putative DNA primase/helicase
MSALLRLRACALGGEVSGRGVSCPGPGHSPRDRSLSVSPSTASPGGFVVFSHAGDDWQACRDHVRERIGLPPFRPGPPQSPAPGAYHGATGHRGSVTPAKAATVADNDNRALALAIWDKAHDPPGTLVEQ